ncbi:hypothetical protein VSX61_10340 [Brenneria populi subsp. brevivirga]|uniref:hypothetical protein n=1 Tax=Brenneria populi TaxID=1505588 RepID=UPI002E18376A|nr:hypothetical protein [Brenneria populi subsp. brevivirga]
MAALAKNSSTILSRKSHFCYMPNMQNADRPMTTPLSGRFIHVRIEGKLDRGNHTDAEGESCPSGSAKTSPEEIISRIEQYNYLDFLAAERLTYATDEKAKSGDSAV